MACSGTETLANTHSVTLSETHSESCSWSAGRSRNNIRLDKIRLDKRGGAGGVVENPASHDACRAVTDLTARIGEVQDPLRFVQAWADSAGESLLDGRDASDIFILQQLIEEARREIRASFVPLALAVEMARPKSEIWSDEGDVGNCAGFGENGPNSGIPSRERA